MTKAEIIEYIDKTLKLFEKAYKLESEENKADLISDMYIFDIEFKIAQFAVKNNHFAKIKDFTLRQLITEEDIEDECGIDVNISDRSVDMIRESLIVVDNGCVDGYIFFYVFCIISSNSKSVRVPNFKSFVINLFLSIGENSRSNKDCPSS